MRTVVILSVRQTFTTERTALAQCDLTISYVSIRVIHNPDKLVYLASLNAARPSPWRGRQTRVKGSLGIVQESDGRLQPVLPITRSDVAEVEDQMKSEFEQMSGGRWSGARGHDMPRREAGRSE